MVRLKQIGNQPFGFTVRGGKYSTNQKIGQIKVIVKKLIFILLFTMYVTGKEHNCGIYVVKVLPSSKAAVNGLKVRDQYTIAHLIHFVHFLFLSFPKAWRPDSSCQWIDSG